MNAEAQPTPNDPFKRANPELVAQYEQGEALFAQLEADFVTDRAAARGGAGAENYKPEEIDALIAQAEQLGGVYRPRGEQGPTDPNFPGGELRGRNDEWQGLLSQMRADKVGSLNRSAAEIATSFKVEPDDLDAQANPLGYLHGMANHLIEQGYVKPETGRAARPDGFFLTDRLMATGAATEESLKDFRKAGEDLVRDQLTKSINKRLDEAGSDEERGRVLGMAMRDAMTQGLIDLVLQRGKGGKGGSPGEVVLSDVSDARVSRVSEIYRAQFEAARADLLSDEAREALDKYLVGISRDLSVYRTQGATARNELMAGIDTTETNAARQKINELEAIQAQREAEASYASNINLTDDQRADYEARNPLSRAGERAQETYDRHTQQIAQFEAMIAATGDWNVRLELQKQLKVMQQDRDKAYKDELERQNEMTASAAKFAREMALHAQRGDHWHKVNHALDAQGNPVEGAEDAAMAMKEALGIDRNTGPFLEINNGRAREYYFRMPHSDTNPGSDRMILFERYDRRTGRLISQTVMTTRDPIRQGRRSQLPPREAREFVNAARQYDEQQRSAREGTGWRRFGRATRDYARLAGRRVVGRGGGADLMYADNGPMARRGADANARRDARNRGARSGGFWYYWFNR